MGQKVNPVGFRLGTSRDHDSIWFAKSKDYSKLVLQDLKIRKRVKEILPQAPISAVVIKRTMEEVIVDIKTSRPGIVIGKKGEEMYREGRVPLHTLKADIDYATSEALTTYGILGVKVWIYRGDANASA